VAAAGRRGRVPACQRGGGGCGGEEGTCASVSREGGGEGLVGALNLKPKRVAKSETAGVLPFGHVGWVTLGRSTDSTKGLVRKTRKQHLDIFVLLLW
jgi:hypothetical protein